MKGRGRRIEEDHKDEKGMEGERNILSSTQIAHLLFFQCARTSFSLLLRMFSTLNTNA